MQKQPLLDKQNNLYIFDCFGVVVSDVSTLWLNKRLNAQQKDYCRKAVFRNVDCGTLEFSKIFGIFSEMCGLPADQVREEWDSLMWVLPDTLEVLVELKQRGGTVVLLSNASEDYIDQLFTQFDLYKYFDKIFVSAHYGYAKPDKELYQICLNSFNQKFENVYFADDNPKNLEGLEQFGIQPLLFTTAAQLKKDLKLTDD